MVDVIDLLHYGFPGVVKLMLYQYGSVQKHTGRGHNGKAIAWACAHVGEHHPLLHVRME